MERLFEKKRAEQDDDALDLDDSDGRSFPTLKQNSKPLTLHLVPHPKATPKSSTSSSDDAAGPQLDIPDAHLGAQSTMNIHAVSTCCPK